MSFEGEGIAENFKVPSFRNAYAKVGMFGTSGSFGSGPHQGDQVKGFGYLHDGSIASLRDFFASETFSFPEPKAQNQADIVRFVMAADSNMAPVVGQQATLSERTGNAVEARVDLLERRAGVSEPRSECDLIARGFIDGLRYSGFYSGENYVAADGIEQSSATLRAAATAPGNALTFTCLPPGAGSRLALDTP